MPRLALPTRHYRVVVTILTGVLAAAASLAAGPRMSAIDGLVYDLSLATTDRRPGTGGEPVAVIAIDGESLDSPELRTTPIVFFTEHWTKLIDGLAANGVRAIGFDIIFKFSTGLFPGFDPNKELALRTAITRARDRIVLAQTVRDTPAFPFIGAIYDPVADAGRPFPGGIANAEIFADSDGVQRLMRPTIVTGEGKVLPTLAAALLSRAHGPRMPPVLLLAPARPLETIPTYRLIDVLRCIDRDPDAIRRAFSGKIVLVGTNLAAEDRKRGPDRFMPQALARPGSVGTCSLPRLGASDWGSQTVPGVFAHAAAVGQVMTGNLVRPLPRLARAATAAAAGVAGAVFGFLLSPWLAAVCVAVLAFAWFGVALLALPLGFWFPAAIPAGSGGGAMVLAYVGRFLAEERRRRRVQRAFSQYVSPFIVDKLADSDAELRLGGEPREVTLMFADLSGFTALSGRVAPQVLTEVTNEYLGLLVAEVEKTGGYVDKFIGDAVMAVWGAPVADADHQANGARAALAGFASVMRAKAKADAENRPGYSVKMGLNSGPAVVGNVGAPGRYNYTAIGETVNIAARLEGVPHDYDCAIVLGPATASAIAGRFVLCELDWIRVKGKEDALAIYDLIAENDQATEAQRAYPAQYAAALALYRAGNFAAAEAAWSATAYPRVSAAPSTPPQVMAARCAELRAAPPADWDGVFVKTTK